MTSECVVLVAVEDVATAGVVAAAAAHIAVDQSATQVVLLHVVDDHIASSGLIGFNTPMPVADETGEEGSSLLSLAEATVRAEYAALDQPAPPVVRQLCVGRPGTVIAQLAANVGATAIVLGARRPHAFGRLAHPDVRSSLVRLTGIPVHVVPLQAGMPETPTTKNG